MIGGVEKTQKCGMSTPLSSHWEPIIFTLNKFTINEPKFTTGTLGFFRWLSNFGRESGGDLPRGFSPGVPGTAAMDPSRLIPTRWSSYAMVMGGPYSPVAPVPSTWGRPWGSADVRALFVGFFWGYKTWASGPIRAVRWLLGSFFLSFQQTKKDISR